MHYSHLEPGCSGLLVLRQFVCPCVFGDIQRFNCVPKRLRLRGVREHSTFQGQLLEACALRAAQCAP
jgi:hypothetical protein